MRLHNCCHVHGNKLLLSDCLGLFILHIDGQEKTTGNRIIGKCYNPKFCACAHTGSLTAGDVQALCAYEAKFI